MKESVRMIIVLTLITIVSGASLALVDKATKPRIEENKVKALNAGLQKLIPAAKNFVRQETQVEGKKYILFKGLDGEILKGWGFLLSGPGFQDKIEIVTATDPDITTLLGIEVLFQNETPGLGAEMVKENFKDQFKGLSVEEKITYVKYKKPEPGANGVQALSAATISTEKLLLIINKSIRTIKEKQLHQRGEK
jgi:RnfABCDGE-type electron transport complex G subunit